MMYTRTYMWRFLLMVLLCGVVAIGCDYDIPSHVSYNIPSRITTEPGEKAKTRDGLFAYRSAAVNPYHDDIVYCTDFSCSLGRLPFIGMDTATPTIDDLLNRLVVSHDWMGERFEAILRAADAKSLSAVLQLSRSITGMVISAKVRPSYYTISKSFMYLDPLRIALTDAELATIDTKPDFRSSFGDDFKFVGAWRYVTDTNEYLYTSTIEGRTLQSAMRYMVRLLAHELAHANDFYPHNVISNISCADPSALRCGLTPWGTYTQWAYAHRLSQQFGFRTPPMSAAYVPYHLNSDELRRYALVRYGGNTASATQKQLEGRAIGENFGADRANHDYSYYSPYEDVAMLVEATLVKYLFNADMDVAYIDRPSSASTPITQAPVSWGRRGRIGDPTIIPRVKQIMNAMLPGFIPDAFYNGLTPARLLNTSCDWVDNLDLSCAPSTSIREDDPHTHAHTDISPDDLDLDFLHPHW